MLTMLIDGNSLTYRAFFALPTDMATASGQVTNAVYGFTAMLINLLRDHRPDRLAVAFDLPDPTFRHRALPTYKGQRDATPDLLVEQFGLVHEILDALAIPRITLAGFEADDLIATLATRARDAGDDVIIVTGDRDAYQLVQDPQVKVLYNRRGVSDYTLYDEAGIESRTGVRPECYVDYAALRGDVSDNLPGVNGVGEKTAAKLINNYGDVEGVLAHADDQTPKLRENLLEGASRARTNVDLMRLVRDVPIEVSLDDLTFHTDVDGDRVERSFAFLEFTGLYDRLAEVVELERSPETRADARVAVPEILVPDSDNELLDEFARLTAGPSPVLIVEVSGPQAESPAAILFGEAEQGTRLVRLDWMWTARPAVVDGLRTMFSSKAVVGHGLKPTFRSLLSIGVELPSIAFDSMLAAYLLDPTRAHYTVEDLDPGTSTDTGPEAATQGSLDFGGPEADDARSVEAARRAAVLVETRGRLEERVRASGMHDLLHDVELPLVGVLARMEFAGVGVDRHVLEGLRRDLTERAGLLATEIRHDAGGDFNVNSTKQLREVLFDRLGLPPQKKTKTGYSTDAATLEKLRGTHPIIGHLLEYREVEKLRSTYGEGLVHEVHSDGRIHATFNQTVARTGRLSSDKPNLHNIPVRTQEGRAFRRAFVPRPGASLLVADYNQVELRCIAHLSGDPGLVGAFARGEDIHAATAARVFGVDVDAVTTEQRAKAKMVSYGLAYGMEAFGLAQRLGIDVGEAAAILDAYFTAFPLVRSYMDGAVEAARACGYTETIFGRRRPIPELASSNARLRAVGERQAMNAGIQGMAADIFKIALIRLDRALDRGDFRSTLILQVHDEVILEVPPDEHDEIADLTRSTMVGAADLSVPLEVHLAFGSNWADAKAS